MELVEPVRVAAIAEPGGVGSLNFRGSECWTAAEIALEQRIANGGKLAIACTNTTAQVLDIVIVSCWCEQPAAALTVSVQTGVASSVLVIPARAFVRLRVPVS